MFSSDLNFIWRIFITFWGVSWWFWLFLFLLELFKSTYLFGKQEKFKRSGAFSMVLLEIKMPKEVKKNPKAMEQILMTLHSLRNAPGNFKEKWIDGEVTVWFSLELVSLDGDIKFFIRIPRSRSSIIEAAFFSYYPDIELSEVDDYVLNLPQNMAEVKEKGLNLWSGEITLQKEGAYPIKTYADFEAIDEEKKYDPMSAFLEILSKAHKEEFVGIQYLIAPADFGWNKKYAKLVEDLKETKDKQKSGAQSDSQSSLSLSFIRTPRETDILKVIEENLSKPAFETLIRLLYISPKELYKESYVKRGVFGDFNQYSSSDLNSFKKVGTTITERSAWDFQYVFPKKRLEYRRAMALYKYIHREMPPQTFMGKLITSSIFKWNFGSEKCLLTTTCLATLFHPPTSVVLTSHNLTTENKKAGPPQNLPIFGEEKEIEKFYE